jgi:hypothetical protein
MYEVVVVLRDYSIGVKKLLLLVSHVYLEESPFLQHVIEVLMRRQYVVILQYVILCIKVKLTLGI